MTGASRFKFGLVLLLCTALLAVRTVGDHLHLCFDGSEPPVSLHSIDGEFEHPPPSVAGGHHDVDLELFHANLAKSFPDPIALLGLICVALLFALAPARERWQFPRSEPVPASYFRYIRPPLRGPPTTRS